MSDHLTKNQNNKADLISGELLWPSAFDAIADGVSIMDSSLTILKANQAMERFYAEAIPQVGKKCHEAYHQRDYPCTACFSLEAFQHKKVCSMIVPRMTGNGQRLWLELFSYPLLDEAGAVDGVVKFARDITARREAEEALRRSEESLATVLQSIGDGVIATDLAGGVVRMNYAAERLTGWKLADATGKPLGQVFQIINTLSGEAAVDPVKSVLENGKVVGLANHTTLLSRDKKQYQIADSAAPIRDSAGKITGVVLVFSDVSAEYKAREALKESGEKLRLLVDNIPGAVYLCHNDQNWTTLYYSEQIERLSGYPSAEFIQKRRHFLDKCHPEDRDIVYLEINRALAQGAAFHLTYRITHADGSIRWIEEYGDAVKKDGHIAYLGGIMFDITDRIRKEEALKASEEKHRDILASIEEGYYETDLEGNIVFCNDAAARLLGYTREELLGMNYRRIYKDHKTAFKTYRQVFLSGKPDRGFILEMLQKDGTVGFGELSISLVKDGDGNITGFRGVARDITERVQFQEKLRFLSLHDQLTGLYNRTFFEEEIQRLSSGREYPVSIIAADLDDLKLTNDARGHHEGDNLLKATAAVLKESLRGSDLLARVGGDEFAVVLPRTNLDTAEHVAARIRESVERYNSKHTGLPLSISLGIATAQTKEIPFKDVYKQADDMMYRDKLTRSIKARGKTVQALLSTLAERDFATEGHAQRLDKYCRKIGEKANLSSGRLSDLAILAQVHDLGKIGIKDSILFKKGLLTEKERELMRSHSEKGYRIALSSADLSGVADLILKHHEWWDGSGYPLGLAGKEIPVECRILAIVDAYDAMTNDRPYGKARSKSEALAELKKFAGSQFDPELTEIFVLILEEEE